MRARARAMTDIAPLLWLSLLLCRNTTWAACARIGNTHVTRALTSYLEASPFLCKLANRASWIQ